MGAGNEQNYPKRMELVWDLEQDDFRIFNWNTTNSSIMETEIDENLLS